MTNTFKSVWSGRELRVEGMSDDEVRLVIQIPGEAVQDIILAPSDAPALALAILEAAGVGDSDALVNCPENGADEHLALIKSSLTQYIEHRDTRAKAEAEQKQLEAEAFKLALSFRRADIKADFTSWDDVVSKDAWLAVAKAAREMRETSDD